MVGRIPIQQASAIAKSTKKRQNKYEEIYQTKVQIEYNIMGEPTTKSVPIGKPDTMKKSHRDCIAAKKDNVYEEIVLPASEICGVSRVTLLIRSLQEDMCIRFLATGKRESNIIEMIETYMLHRYGQVSFIHEKRHLLLQSIKDLSQQCPLLRTMDAFISSSLRCVESLYWEMVVWLQGNRKIKGGCSDIDTQRLVSKDSISDCVDAVFNLEGRNIPPIWFEYFNSLIESETSVKIGFDVFIDVDEILSKIMDHIIGEAQISSNAAEMLFKPKYAPKLVSANGSQESEIERSIMTLDNSLSKLRYLTDEFAYRDVLRTAIVSRHDFENICRRALSGLWHPWKDAHCGDELELELFLSIRDNNEPGLSYLDFLISIHNQIIENASIDKFSNVVSWLKQHPTFTERQVVENFVLYITTIHIMKHPPVTLFQEKFSSLSPEIGDEIEEFERIEMTTSRSKAILNQIDMSVMFEANQV